MDIRSIADKIRERVEVFGVEDFTLKNGMTVNIYRIHAMYALEYPNFFRAYARPENLVMDLIKLVKGGGYNDLGRKDDQVQGA